VNPQPYPTRLERAAEFDVAAKIAHENGDPTRAEKLCREAHLLRMQEAQEAKNAQ
jgi:hypothetical protein